LGQHLGRISDHAIGTHGRDAVAGVHPIGNFTIGVGGIGGIGISGVGGVGRIIEVVECGTI